MNSEIVQIVQELSTGGGVETVAAELARIVTRNGLPNVVLASTVSGRSAAAPARDTSRS